MIEPQAALIGLRAVSFAAAALLFGGLSALTLEGRTLRFVLQSRLMPALRLAALALFAATMAMMPVLAASAAEGWTDAVDLASLRDLALSTRTGNAIVVRIVIAALIIYGTWRWRRLSFASICTCAALAGMYIASFAFTGHALLHQGILGLMHQLNHIVHVLAGSFWIGALLPLLIAVGYLNHPVLRPRALKMLDRFSFAGSVAVTLIAASGAINTALILGKLPLDLSSTYQSLLLAKIALVIAMLTLAAANRWWLVPRAHMEHNAAGLPVSIAAECVAGVCVIVLVAIFGTMEPV